METPLDPPAQLCKCALLSAGAALERATDRIEALVGTLDERKNAPVRDFQRELANTRREWRLLYDTHVTTYRDEYQRALVQYAKNRALNADVAKGGAALDTGVWSTGAVRAARAPATTRKRARDKRPDGAMAGKRAK